MNAGVRETRNWRRELDRTAGEWALNVVSLDSLDSTQALARRVAEDALDDYRLPRRAVIAAWEQSAGRGRRGRGWSSPAGSGVYLTWIEPLAEDRGRGLLPLRVAVALAESLSPILDTPCRLKWPNDLLVEGAKLGGILIDVLDRPDVGAVALIGCGVNHSHRREDLPARPATTLLECGCGLDLATVTGRLVAALAQDLASPVPAEDLIDRYRACSAHRHGETLEVATGEEILRGAFDGFDEQGRLRLVHAGAVRHLAAGDLL